MFQESHDIFISHASEDKDTLVRDLARALKAQGLKVWYDEFSLKAGDSLRQSIDKGIYSSRHGLLIISKAFISKQWPNWEVNGLLQTYFAGSSHRLIPVWFEVTGSEVREWSPSVADLVAIKGDNISQIKEQILKAVNADEISFYRREAVESDQFAYTIPALDASFELLMTEPEVPSYALYKPDIYKDNRKVLSILLGRNRKGEDSFKIVLGPDALAELREREGPAVYIQANEPVFNEFFLTPSQEIPKRNALMLVPVVCFRHTLSNPSYELLLVLRATDKKQFVTNERIIKAVSRLLGAVFKPIFREPQSG